MSGVRKSGPHSRPNRAKYNHRCVMCGVLFITARPVARTNNATCRSALRRWLNLFGYIPSAPPGTNNWHRTKVGKEAYAGLYKQKTALQDRAG